MPSDFIQSFNCIVVKVGSAILADEKSGQVRQDWLVTLAQDVAALVKQGKKIIIVSSGAIALGRKDLGIKYTDRPSSIPLAQKQAAAALGQVEVSRAYADVFAEHDLTTASVLLSPRDTEDRRSHLNARATLLTLMENGVIAIINENDTVSTVEMRFGDNDRLAARVAQMIEADLLVQLSTTDGLYSADPTQDSMAEHIPYIEKYSDELMVMAGDAPAGLSTGGMKSKLEAARIAVNAGVHMMIASGKNNHPLSRIERATIFQASGKPVSARKKWIASHVKAEGVLIIDDGAVQALQNGKSLLPAGVVKVEGDFKFGDPVAVKDKEGHQHAMGLMAYSADEARLILGCKSGDIGDVLGYARGKVLIHRADLVLSS